MLLPSRPDPSPGDLTPVLLVKGFPLFDRSQPVGQCRETRQLMVAELRRVHRHHDYNETARLRWWLAHDYRN